MDEELMNRIEAQRLELEANVAKLRKALSHWQTLELDYEGLKDEFQGLHGNVTKQQYIEAAHDFGPHKVDDKELSDLIEPSKGKIRQPSQVIETLSKRVDYVTRNISSLRNQIADLEKKRNSILLAGKPEHEQEAGLPIAEITEELDDDGNVISSKIQPQGETASKVLGVLEKANAQPEKSAPNTIPILPEKRITEIDDHDNDSNQHDFMAVDKSNTTRDQEALQDKEKEADKPSKLVDYPTNPQDSEEEAQMRQEMLEYGFGLPEVGKIVAELELAEGENDTTEGDEDVDMVEDLSDNNSIPVDDFDDDEDFSDDDSDMEEDDDGRVKGSLHSEQYRRQMDELQKQLGFEMANVGPNPSLPAEIRDHIEHPPEVDAQKYIENLPPGLRKHMESRPPAKEAARKAAIAREEALRNSQKDNGNGGHAAQMTKGKSKKKVAFAPELDIAQGTSDASVPKATTTTDTVIERASSTGDDMASAPPTQRGPAKTSRFKASRAAHPQTPLFPPPMDFPTSSTTSPPQELGPPNKTHADTLIERPSSDSLPSAPDDSGLDFDEELQKRQIALEHFNLKNKMVHEQGGYVRGGELENWGDEYAAPEVLDEKTGQPRKISRFKAARMRG